MHHMGKQNGRVTRSISCAVDDDFLLRLRLLTLIENTSQAAIVRRAVERELRRNADKIENASFFELRGTR